MGFDAKNLARGEKIVFRTHAHWKNLVVPALIFVLIVGAVTWTLLWVAQDRESRIWAQWTAIGLGALIVAVWSVAPLLVWATSTDTLTTQRLISEQGVISRRGKELPITRVHAVSYRQRPLDRILGCGTLVVQTAGDDSDVLLYDVAHLKRRRLQMQELLLGLDIPSVEPDADLDGVRAGSGGEAESGGPGGSGGGSGRPGGSGGGSGQGRGVAQASARGRSGRGQGADGHGADPSASPGQGAADPVHHHRPPDNP